jgi:hypothetical protein
MAKIKTSAAFKDTIYLVWIRTLTSIRQMLDALVGPALIAPHEH